MHLQRGVGHSRGCSAQWSERPAESRFRGPEWVEVFACGLRRLAPNGFPDAQGPKGFVGRLDRLTPNGFPDSPCSDVPSAGL